MDTTIYVRALSNGEWFGGWAPIRAKLEWIHEDGRTGLFTLQQEDLDADDEYEYFEHGTLVLGTLADEDFRVQVGLKMEKIDSPAG